MSLSSEKVCLIILILVVVDFVQDVHGQAAAGAGVVKRPRLRRCRQRVRRTGRGRCRLIIIKKGTKPGATTPAAGSGGGSGSGSGSAGSGSGSAGGSGSGSGS
ncbi:hypothetical protein HDE_00327 [Halotydeus destructor]|nr:hypothetical protein HDE_00327 [Halotydeus destructor]